MLKRELERKQRAEQEAAAHAFQEFIQTFQDTSGPPNKMFVKSGILNSKTGQEVQSEKGQLYNPQPLLKSNSSEIIKNAIECARLLKDSKLERIKGQEKPKTNLELLKDELKLRHMQRNEKNKDDASHYSSLAALDSSTDPSTTNLFIANISSKLTEQDLMQIFGAYGPLASVKIMWPRSDDKNRHANCGFVAFMSRKDGERAMQGLKDRNDMRIGWGKPVELPEHPIYIPPELLKSLLPPPYSGLPFNAQPFKQPFKYPTNDQELEELLHDSIVKVTIPLDKRILMTVHRVIEYVIREGPLFEAMIMNREMNNPIYQFLFDNRDPIHTYYRWKLYSILHGENLKNWSTTEFRMFKSGSIWRPPVVPNYTKGMPEHLIHSDKVNKSMLSDAQRSRFIQLIQTLNLSKTRVGEAMVFCINHVDAVKDVVDIIIDSFKNDSTKPPKKIARLYLLCDILYNSSMKKCYAPIYHEEFEKHLPDIFAKLHDTYKNLLTVTDKDIFKSKVFNVLRSWNLWKIYPNDYLYSLENIFLGINTENEDNESDTDDPLDGIKLRKTYIASACYTDCIMKNDVIQEIKPRTKPIIKHEHSLSGFIVSKWETVDPEQVEAQAMSTKKFYNLEIERQLQEGTINNEKQSENISKKCKTKRETLNKLEMMDVPYLDEQERGERKHKKGRQLEKELHDYRSYLLHKLEKEREHKNKRSSDIFHSDNTDTESQIKRKKHKKCKKHHDHMK